MFGQISVVTHISYIDVVWLNLRTYHVGMFVRINKSGERRYLQVVESYRNEDGKPRHRVVANLGRVDGMEEGHLDALIRGLCRVAGRDEPIGPEIVHEPAKAGYFAICLGGLVSGHAWHPPDVVV
jgi:hypothetical protein